MRHARTPYAPVGFVYHARTGDTPEQRTFIAEELILWEFCIKQLSVITSRPVLVRFVFSWAIAEQEDGLEDQIEAANRLGNAGAKIMPCVMWSAPHKALSWSAASPPKPEHYRDLQHSTEVFLNGTAHTHSEYAQFWNEVNGDCYWKRSDDPLYTQFSCLHRIMSMLLRKAGFQVVLPGPIYENGGGASWLNLMGLYGSLHDCDVVGLHTFPGTWADNEQTLEQIIDRFTKVLYTHGKPMPFMLCETSFATRQAGSKEHEPGLETGQVKFLNHILQETAVHEHLVGPVLWHTLCDLPTSFSSAIVLQNKVTPDYREHACGLWRDPTTPKAAWQFLVENAGSL